jgi:hypothetical protein
VISAISNADGQENLLVVVGEYPPAAPSESYHPILPLNWKVLSSEDFERIIFNIVADAIGYHNPQVAYAH